MPRPWRRHSPRWAPPAAALTALQCGHLIDTVNGKTLGATTMVIEGGKIKEVSIPSTTSA